MSLPARIKKCICEPWCKPDISCPVHGKAELLARIGVTTRPAVKRTVCGVTTIHKKPNGERW